MKRKELSKKVACRIGIAGDEVDKIVRQSFNSINYELSRGNDVHIEGFGTFHKMNDSICFNQDTSSRSNKNVFTSSMLNLINMGAMMK